MAFAPRVFFVNRYFFPDQSATSQILTDLCQSLAVDGRPVHVVCSRQRIDEPAAGLPAEEVVQGIHVHRVWTSRFGRGRLAGRLCDYLSFYVSAAFGLLRLVRRGDVIVAKTDPPMISVVTATVALLRGAVAVNWLQDLFPEVAAAAGIAVAKGPAGAGLRHLRNWSLRRAAVNVVIGRRMAALLQAEGIARESVRIVQNWSDGAQIRPVAASGHRLRREWQLEGRFVAAYSGNLGRVHDFDTILGAARRLREDRRIVFLIIGSGQQRAALAEVVRAQGLDNVRFLPPQPRELLEQTLTLPDLHFVTLKPAMEGLVVPSKFYGVAAAGRATLFIGALDGEVARLVADHDCGRSIAPGDDAALAALLQRWCEDPAEVERLGRNARSAFEREFDRPVQQDRWRVILDEIAVRR